MGAAVAQVTQAVSPEPAWVASAGLKSEVFAEVISRAFPEVPLAMPRELAMERAFSVVAIRF